MTPYLPISLRLEGGDCLVVGGGAIALQKVRVLRAAGGRVRVIAPALLAELATMREVACERRAFTIGDLEGAVLAIAATDEPAINLAVYEAARARGVPVNVVDDPTHCDFIFPSILRRGELTVAVSTGGAGPALARMLRELLEEEFDECYGDILIELRRLRRRAREEIRCAGARRAIVELMSLEALRARHSGRSAAEFARRMERLIEELADHRMQASG